MKKTILIIMILLLLSPVSKALNQDFRGVWVSSVYNLDYPSEKGLSEQELMSEADKIIETVSGANLTDIFFQVRPTCDALYNSKLFPQSEYITGTQGNYAENKFDPLKYFIEKAKKSNISIHAWINPYRITKTSFSTKENAFASLSKNNPAFLLKMM